VGFAAESGHAGGLVVGAQFELLAGEGVDLGTDCGLFVGDDPVGDVGVDQRHFHLAVSESGTEERGSLRELLGEEPANALGSCLIEISTADMPRVRAIVANVARTRWAHMEAIV
jgi:hypothetical protein